MIMVAWMDSVRYNRKGNEVMLVKKILNLGGREMPV